jgi:hypothetical protein
MNPRFQRTLFACLILLSAVGLAWAQTPADPPSADPQAKKKDKETGTEVPVGEAKDPTRPSPKLKDLLYPEKSGRLTGAGPAPKMPVLGLRGRVVGKDQPAVGLLEVDGKVFLIAKGSSLPTAGGTLRIIDITSREVRIEVLKEIIILR